MTLNKIEEEEEDHTCFLKLIDYLSNWNKRLNIFMLSYILDKTLTNEMHFLQLSLICKVRYILSLSKAKLNKSFICSVENKI